MQTKKKFRFFVLASLTTRQTTRIWSRWRWWTLKQRMTEKAFGFSSHSLCVKNVCRTDESELFLFTYSKCDTNKSEKQEKTSEREKICWRSKFFFCSFCAIQRLLAARCHSFTFRKRQTSFSDSLIHWERTKRVLNSYINRTKFDLFVE